MPDPKNAPPPAPETRFEPRLLTLLQAAKWVEFAGLARSFSVVSPSDAGWAHAVAGVADAAAAGDWIEATHRLWLDHTDVHVPSPIAQALNAGLAKGAEATQPWVTAWLVTRDPTDAKGMERGAQIARRLGGKPDDVVPKYNEVAAVHVRAGIEADGNATTPRVRMAGLLVDADPVIAYQAVEHATQVDPRCRAAWLLLADLSRRARGEQAAHHVLDVAAERNPTAAWPWLARARPIADTDFAGALRFADRALAAEPENPEALELRRRLLRKLERWQDLVEHLEFMTGTTLDRALLAEYFDEWARMTSGPLRDAISAVELQKQATFFADPTQVADFYWKNLSENEKSRQVWDEVDAFFRTNRMWPELGRLLIMKLERAFGDDRIGIVAQLRSVWAMVPQRGEAAWIDVVQAEIERAGQDDTLKEALESLLEGVDVPEPEKPQADIAPYLLVAAGVLVVVVIVLIAATLMPFFI